MTKTNENDRLINDINLLSIFYLNFKLIIFKVGNVDYIDWNLLYHVLLLWKKSRQFVEIIQINRIITDKF